MLVECQWVGELMREIERVWKSVFGEFIIYVGGG